MLREHKISRGNVWNFDETGFRVGCPKGEVIYVPLDVKEVGLFIILRALLINKFYLVSPENRRSLTAIEAVSASGRTIPPVIIIQGKHHMDSWYRERLGQKEVILLSDSGFTNDQLTFRFLQHFIEYTKASPSKLLKLLLIDNYSSYYTLEFIILATSCNFVLFPFLLYLTYYI